MISILTRVFSIYDSIGLPNVNADNFAGNIKNIIFGLAAVIALFYLALASFKYVSSGGNPEQTKKATQTIVYASIGLFVILTSYTIATWVFNVGAS